MATFSGLFDHVHGDGHTLIGNKQPHVAIGRALKPYGRGKFRTVLRSLVGAAAGATASKSHTRVKAELSTDHALGGVRTIETTSLVNRATTSADVAEMQAALDYARLTDYPADASGNGGGGKLGY